MSKNRHSEEAFDLWLSASLKTARPANPAFSQKIVREIERTKAQELLRRAVRQERLSGAIFVLTAAGGLVLLCCKPVLRMVYSVLEAGLVSLIQTIMEPARLNLGIFALVLLGLCLLTKSLWDNLTAEM
ncbi:MAG: hypothetical protein FJ263_07025 [Planctomycetes bacterium]|nr:hypothetical protein [Planctomycetota bacterium]